jgi:hypothetical protein
MSNDAKLFKNWDGFLPPNAVVMGKRIAGESVPPQTDSHSIKKIQIVLSHPLRGETNELFAKILQAMNWVPADIELSVENEIQKKSDDSPGFFTIRMVGGSEVGRVTQSSLITYSLEEMLSDPKLKREVWSHLKSTHFPK